MKRVALCIVIMAFIISGCAGTLDSIYPKPPTTICDQPEYAESVICAIGKKLNMYPEQMDAVLLDATLVPIALKKAKAKDMMAAIEKVEKWVGSTPEMTMIKIKNYLYEEAKIDPVIGIIISRRMPMFANVPGLSDKLFTLADFKLVKIELENQKEQLKILL